MPKETKECEPSACCPLPPKGPFDPDKILRQVFLWELDIIVMRIDAPGLCFQHKDQLFINIDFYKRCRPILNGEGRINVANFCMKEPLCQFEAEHLSLVNGLITNGLTFMIKYCNELIACGHLQPSDNFIEKLRNIWSPGELIRTFEVILTRGKCTVGIMTVRLRLRKLCMPEKEEKRKSKKRRSKKRKSSKKKSQT